MKSASGFGRADQTIGNGRRCSLEEKSRWFEDVFCDILGVFGSLRSFGKSRRVDILRIIGIDQFSLSLATDRWKS